MEIARHHPLRRLFEELVRRRLYDDARFQSPDVADYISDLLVRFTRADSLYSIRNARGHRLDDVGEMLLESNPLLSERGSLIREREVRKHVGDYTLFMCGLFPQWVAKLPSRRPVRLDSFVDYMEAGKESYRVVASFREFEFREQAGLFGRLAERFELCVFGLNLVSQDLERLQGFYYSGVKRILGGEPN